MASVGGVGESNSEGAFGRYRIVERIARGGMAEVYRAEAQTFGGVAKVVALKLVRPEFAGDPAFVRMFLEEAKLSVLLSHANLVHVFDAGRIDDRYFMAMEFVEGSALNRVLRACARDLGQPLPHRHAIHVAVDALKGLDYAHRRADASGRPLAIVHRDVSPSNILVSNEGEVKIADFGIASSVMRTTRTDAGMIKGKLSYMAPEQLRGARADARTDIYSMGAVLYQMLTLELPFPNASFRTIPDIVAGRFRRPREIVPDMPERLDAVILRAMAVDPDGRFPSAAEMRVALEGVAHAEGHRLSTMDLAAFLSQMRDARGSSLPSPETSFELRPGEELAKMSDEDAHSVYGRTASTSGQTTTLAPTKSLRASGSRSRSPAVAKMATIDRPPALGVAPGPRPESNRVRTMAIVLIVSGALGGLAWGTLRVVRQRHARARLSRPLAPALLADTPAGPAPPATPAQPAAAPAVPESAVVVEGSAPPEAKVAHRDPHVRHGPHGSHRSAARGAGEPALALLSIGSESSLKVYVDGVAFGNTPLDSVEVLAGAHRIDLRDASGAVVRTLELTLGPGEHRRVSVSAPQIPGPGATP